MVYIHNVSVVCTSLYTLLTWWSGWLPIHKSNPAQVYLSSKVGIRVFRGRHELERVWTLYHVQMACVSARSDTAAHPTAEIHTGVRTSHCSSMKWSPRELSLSYNTLRQKRPAFTNTVQLECRPAQTWLLCLQAKHFIARVGVRHNNRDSWAYWETHFECMFWQFSVI